MRELMLLRHAKSRWDEEDVGDHDRGLAPRGRRAAPLIGEVMRREGLLPDLVLCSTARRARETLALLGIDELLQDTLRLEPQIYEATPARLAAIVREVEDRVQRVLMIGHNPGMQAFALDLAVLAPDHPLRVNMPTAALLRVGLDIPDWRALAPAAGVELGYWEPRQLEKA